MKPRPTQRLVQCLTDPRIVAPLWAAGLVFLTVGFYVNTKPGWNVNSQFGMTCAIVLQGRLTIDSFHERPETATGDKSYFEGHFYCDKSPVTPLLGVPALFVYRQAHKLAGYDFSFKWARYWTTWLTIGTCAALLAFFLARLFIGLGLAPVRSALGALLWVTATPVLGYSTVFYNYTPGLLFAVAGMVLLRPALTAPEARQWRRVLAAGALVGLACWTLNTFALVALGLTFVLCAAHWRSRTMWTRLFPAWAAGGVLGAMGYFIYSYMLFGSFESPYVYEYDDFFREQMAKGLMGATMPKPIVLLLITFHKYQGLFVYFPITLAAVAGLFGMLGRRGLSRVAAVAALGVFAAMLLYNSAYFLWWGGWAYAPRHLIPTLPLVALGLIPFMRSWRWFAPVLVLGLAGTAANLLAVAWDPQSPQQVPTPLMMQPEQVEAWPAPFLDGVRKVVVEHWTDENWGSVLGLEGRRRLIPLTAIWAVFAGLLGWVWRVEQGSAGDEADR